ncbi:DUF5689 domain-containing protein [Aquimarina brevivitae]|uniref:DUF5689 domain-containing protein n=1 Tax=Aquimarina brevivitae TaxID=323412 RepID=A0A4Q7PK80_9FLAO|nr:DUF5689 domain-containing protein [Aquimarina brevivitae]RZS99352.1 hypothetical protein EV197_0562 [Aquimarina brevivitae]
MNSINYKLLLGALLVMLGVTSCVQDDDFTLSPLEINEPQIDGQLTTVDGVVDVLLQEINDEGNDDVKVTFEDTNLYMEAYVISSDRAGNFFEELIVQDRAEVPTAGLRIPIDVNPLYVTYEFGRKIYVKLDGLSVGLENGVPTLGVLSSDRVNQIPSFLQEEYITRSAEVATIVPLEITIEDFSDDIVNLFVTITDLQFNRADVLVNDPLSFAGEPTDEFDGERTLESCATGASAILSTSTFADFKSLDLPAQRGSFEGVLTKNFFGDEFNLVLNSVAGLQFDNPDRCDPNVLECTGESGGSTTIFSENFTGLSSTDLTNAGWINQNVTGGSLDYEIGSFSGNQYAQITGFRSGENPFEVWLVTPEINLDGSTAEELAFDLQVNFDNGNILTVFITDNFTGDITTTEWAQLDVTIPRGPSGSFGSFESVGPVNISCLDGNVRVAFRYKGADPGPTTRYHIDNLEISGN